MTREIVRKLGPGNFGIFDQKSDHSSTSVCSIDSGPIFHPRSVQELSRNAFVVSILFPERNSYVWKGPGYDPENRDFHEKCSLQASCSFWAALPGAPAPGKVLRPQGNMPNDS